VFPFIAPYCASKRALDILFNSMQVECGENIRVISIKPGVVMTPLWEKSIATNLNVLNENGKYQKESEMLIKNAQKNTKRGLTAQEVADFIVKIEGLENPKPSYTIGKDAKLAEIFSHLPQVWINWVIKKAIKQRVRNN